MRKVYIAGPMTGIPEFNRPAFYEVADKIRQCGDIPLNPAVLPDGLSQEEYMMICTQMIFIADAIYTLPNWTQSEGARAEYSLAVKCGKDTMGFIR